MAFCCSVSMLPRDLRLVVFFWEAPPVEVVKRLRPVVIFLCCIWSSPAIAWVYINSKPRTSLMFVAYMNSLRCNFLGGRRGWGCFTPSQQLKIYHCKAASHMKKKNSMPKMRAEPCSLPLKGSLNGFHIHPCTLALCPATSTSQRTNKQMPKQSLDMYFPSICSTCIWYHVTERIKF